MPRTDQDPAFEASSGPSLWGRILERVRAKVNPQSYSTWFEPTQLLHVHEGELVVEGPNQFFVDWLAEHHLEKLYRFRNFQEALDFTNRVGEMAEEQFHHPDIHLAWGRVGITIWTHKIGGLTESDFVFAAKTDRLYAG